MVVVVVGGEGGGADSSDLEFLFPFPCALNSTTSKLLIFGKQNRALLI